MNFNFQVKLLCGREYPVIIMSDLSTFTKFTINLTFCTLFYTSLRQKYLYLFFWNDRTRKFLTTDLNIDLNILYKKDFTKNMFSVKHAI